jgi:hypothetical protein
VSNRAKRVFDVEAANRGLNLVDHLDQLADAAWGDQVGREFRESRRQALEGSGVLR